MKPTPGITITEQQSGPSAWATALIGGLIAGAAVLLALAIWQISIGLSVAVGAVGIGIAAERVCYGLSMLVYRARLGQAEIERARLQGTEYPRLEAGSWDNRQSRP